MNWKWFFVLLLLLLLVIFTTQNYELVEIKFLFWSFQTSRAIIIFVTLFIGVIIGWLTSFLRVK
ncbi:lipopolysaccharide assembly protein LapA domain-containing protein [Candidatus Omnitrophota bacterium]